MSCESAVGVFACISKCTGAPKKSTGTSELTLNDVFIDASAVIAEAEANKACRVSTSMHVHVGRINRLFLEFYMLWRILSVMDRPPHISTPIDSH